MLLADANMSYLGAKLPYDLHLGIPQPGPAVLDAKRPLAAEGLMMVHDAKGVAFGDALVVVVLVATGADRVVDARETDVLHRKDPVSVRRGVVGAAGAPKTAAGILGAECRRESKKEKIQGGYQLHLGDMYVLGPCFASILTQRVMEWNCGQEGNLVYASPLDRRYQYAPRTGR